MTTSADIKSNKSDSQLTSKVVLLLDRLIDILTGQAFLLTFLSYLSLPSPITSNPPHQFFRSRSAGRESGNGMDVKINPVRSGRAFVFPLSLSLPFPPLPSVRSVGDKCVGKERERVEREPTLSGNAAEICWAASLSSMYSSYNVAGRLNCDP